MGWRIIEVRSNDNLRLHLNNLLIKRLDKKILINIPDIDILILDNLKINISVQLINELISYNVVIIVCNTKHEPASYIFAINGNHNSLKIFEKQMNWTKTYKGYVWKQIIQNKIANQAKNLEINNIKYNKSEFQKLINETHEYDVSNREGHAAKIYWHYLFSKKFTRDYKSVKNHTINSVLNYGYALIRSLVIKSIIKKGLDTRISLFHKSFSNFFALASDLMEPFRPIIDNATYKFKDAEFFNYDIKGELIEVLNEKITINGKKEFLNNAIDKCIDNMIAGKGWLWVDIWK